MVIAVFGVNALDERLLLPRQPRIIHFIRADEKYPLAKGMPVSIASDHLRTDDINGVIAAVSLPPRAVIMETVMYLWTDCQV